MKVSLFDLPPATSKVSQDKLRYHLSEWEKNSSHDYLVPLLAPLNIRADAVVLDLGCGSGFVAAFLSGQKEVKTSLAVDVDSRVIQLARELTGLQAAREIHWICAKAEEIPLPSRSVDHIICRAVLPYTEIGGAVTEIARLLRTGGSLVLLLHPWTLYANKLSLNPMQLKTSAAMLAILLVGLVFHVTGKQFRPRLGPWQIKETFQTLNRMRKVLCSQGLSVDQVESSPEFILYASKLSTR